MKLVPLAALWAVSVLAQRDIGELRLTVRDPSGAALEARVELTSHVNQLGFAGAASSEGRYIARRLPFGLYHLRVERAGFAGHTSLVEIRSAAPLELRVALGVAVVETTLVVSDSDTVLDPHRTGTAFTVGRDALRERPRLAPGRTALEVVNEQPGWLLEANGVLHPRGSEYSTQYIIDGVPITDNRSPGVGPAMEVGQLESMTVLTGNYPAEYGRKLGGVVELQTERSSILGLHGRAAIHGGSFLTQGGQAAAGYSSARTAAALGIDGVRSDRYLDPPVEENFTNRASSAGVSGRLERDLGERDRLRVYLHGRRTLFQVPNDREQEQSGQRQDRRNRETLGQIAWQRVLSPRLLASVRGMARDLASELWSNFFATPISAEQDRGFREGYLSAQAAYNRSGHEVKAGVETIHTSLRESFSYRITDPRPFDDDLARQFRFADRRNGHEHSLYVQDLIRAGKWTFSAGLRLDRYSVLVSEHSLSPRLGIAWHWPSEGLVLRASYDRAVETPAIEGLLLASSSGGRTLAAHGAALPLRPSRGHFYQAGFSKSLFQRARLDAVWFRRRIRDFADDSLLLNTGVSFPISFSSASIHGIEAKLEIPRWGPVSGFVSYSNQHGTGRLPVTGGLFLEEGAEELLQSTASFPISQDQRNTARARMRSRVGPRAWVAAGASYGSGLPIEREGDDEFDLDELREQFGARLLDHVNLARGRVRPQFSVDATAGSTLWRTDAKSLRVQADVFNITNRLNVINFTGLFSGTALAAPRSFALRIETEF